MDLGAVIVHFRTPDALALAVANLHAQGLGPDRIVVVDTGAAQDGVTRPPVAGCRWVPAPSNIGFGAAANLGATRLAHVDALLVQNADLRLRAGAVRTLARLLEDEAGAAAVAPRIVAADGTIELNARRFPTVSTGIAGRSSLLTRCLRAVGRTPAQLLGATAAQARRVDWVSGACMLIRRSDWEACGGFDTRYWMYWEDADLCRRLAQRGRETWIQPDAVADHATGSSGRSARTVAAFHVSAARYYDRHLGKSPLDRTLAHLLLAARARVVRHRLER